MRTNLLLAAVAGMAALVMYTGPHLSTPLRAQSGVALTGRVSSEQEGPMEGVVVSARREGSTDLDFGRDRRQGPLQLPGSEARGR